MNELDIAALNTAVQLGRCWQGVILCPSADGSGEYNLLGKEAQPFRITKCAVKAGENVSHSRQRMSGIRIPTLFPAVVSEWWNVKTQISTWAWNGGSSIIAKHHQGTRRCNLLDKAMRCSRCEYFTSSSSSGLQEVSTLS
jgi:hypothetical protein